MKIKYSPSNKILGSIENIVYDDTYKLLDITSEFVKFKNLYKDFFKNFYDIKLSNETCKIIFVEIIFYMHNNDIKELLGDHIIEAISDLVEYEGCIDYDELLEIPAMVHVFDIILTKINKKNIIDYVLYKISIKLVYKD